MPIKVMSDLPAKAVIEQENIFIMDENRALSQRIRPLQIAILNLMPLKQETEIQLLRCLSNSPLQVDLIFVNIDGHISKNTPQSHINKFYVPFSEIRERRFDGMIITGAPIEQMPFEEVTYWDELKEIMEWTKDHVTSTMHLCWGAQAGLYYHYGIKKIMLDKKMFGIFEHHVLHRKTPLLRGMDDVFLAPHSRYTAIDEEGVRANPKLQILAESDEAGIFLVMAEDGKQIFVIGHPEYDRQTLDDEYKRDLAKGIDIEIPKNYYPDDDPSKQPLLTWRSCSNCIYTNYLNYYVYQVTPYVL